MTEVPPLVAKVLAELRHEVRLPILLALEARPRSATQLVEDLGFSYNTVNHALRQLERAHLVVLVHEGVTDTHLQVKTYGSSYRGWSTIIDAVETIVTSPLERPALS